MRRRLIAFLLAVCTMLAIVPETAIAAGEKDVTIAVVDVNGNNITEGKLSVKVTRVYGPTSNRTQNVKVTDSGNGVFVFTDNKKDTKYYTVTATLVVDGRTYTSSQRVNYGVNSAVLTLEDYVEADQWATFDIYYIADGHFPDSFYGAADEKDYGPAGDDTPLLSINVNITALKKLPGVLYQENVGNAYHFIPERPAGHDEVYTFEENLQYSKIFWEQVKTCMDEESIAAFEATGLYDTFVGYCLKNQGTAASPDNHGDGILSVTPPVYVIEMYDHHKEIFGGYTNDQETITSRPVPLYGDKEPAVLLAYNKHFKQDIEWHKDEDDFGTWVGSYITIENGRKYQYNLAIKQINAQAAVGGFTSGSGIKYEKKTDTYYLAAFQSETQSVELIDCIVTYSDGANGRVFNDHKTALDKGASVVPFNGSTDRENFIFLGWTLEGGDGTLLTQQDILDTYTTVTEDLTFVAVYTVAPAKHAGTVQVILNGNYDSVTATASGQLVDITTVLNGNISLYVSADGVDFIPLTHKSTGVYSAELVNGTYAIYYFDGTNYILSSDQHLNINNDDRTRYIFFNSVTYDLNGGIGGPSPLTEYHPSETAVNVSAAIPTRDRYIFTGWKDQDGNIYSAGAPLTVAISQGYTLTAQWIDAEIGRAHV